MQLFRINATLQQTRCCLGKPHSNQTRPPSPSPDVVTNGSRESLGLFRPSPALQGNAPAPAPASAAGLGCSLCAGLFDVGCIFRYTCWPLMIGFLAIVILPAIARMHGCLHTDTWMFFITQFSSSFFIFVLFSLFTQSIHLLLASSPSPQPHARIHFSPVAILLWWLLRRRRQAARAVTFSSTWW